MALRAAPRVGTLALAVGAGLWSAGDGSGSVLGWLWVPMSVAALPPEPRLWWRYVLAGTPTPWQVAHGGSVRFFVSDRGRNGVQVIARLREAGRLTLGETVRRLAHPADPVFDDLTADSAARLKTILEEAGATVRIADDA
jgi:hypothetical protein